MKARVELGGSKAVLNMLELPKYYLQRALCDLTFDNPEYVGLVRHRPKLLRMMRVKGEPIPPEKLKFYSASPEGVLTVPRSYDLGIEEEVALDQRVSVPVAWPEPKLYLRDSQDAALAAVKGKDHGMLVLPTGAGKTILGLEVGRRLGQRTLVLCCRDKTGLRNWQLDCDKYLGVEPGIIQGTNTDYSGDEPVVVAMVQTLWQRRELLAKMADSFGCLIVDECHHTPAYTFGGVVGAINAKFFFGMSATPDRTDGLTSMIRHVFGPRLFEVRQAAEVVPVTVRIVRTGFRNEYVEGDKGKKDYNGSLKALTLSDSRNLMVAQYVVEETRKLSLSSIVVTHRIPHSKVLANLIAEQLGETSRVGLLVGSGNVGLKWKKVSGGAEDGVWRTQLKGYEMKMFVARNPGTKMYMPSVKGNDFAEVFLAPERTLVAAQTAAEAEGNAKAIAMFKAGRMPKRFPSKTGPELLPGIEYDQEKVIEGAKDGSLDIVVGSFQYVKEGLDIPRWDALFMATPTRNRIELKQTIGRVRREFPKKEKGRVYDFYDAVGMFDRFYKGRTYIYRQLERESMRERAGKDLFGG